MPEPEDFVICRVPGCGKRFQRISSSHLKFRHGWTMDQYHEMFPDAPVDSTTLNKRKSAYMTGVKRKNTKPKKIYNDYVTCMICGDRYAQITEGHLNKHGYTFKRYVEEFPEAKTMADCVRQELRDNNPMNQPVDTPMRKKHKKNVKKGCNTPKEKKRRSEDNCMRRPEVAKKSSDSRKGQKRPDMVGDKNVMCRPEMRELARQNWLGDKNPVCKDLKLMREKVWQMQDAHKTEDTSIEKILHQILDELEATWEKKRVRVLEDNNCNHIFDAVVTEYKKVQLQIGFEADGCHYHQCPKCDPKATHSDTRVLASIKNDTFVNSMCVMCEIPLYRFWGHELLQEKELVKDRIWQLLERHRLERLCSVLSA